MILAHRGSIPSIRRHSLSEPELESIALGVVNEPEKEEDMNDLRVEFKERHHKCL